MVMRNNMPGIRMAVAMAAYNGNRDNFGYMHSNLYSHQTEKNN
jgi:hypothetical protein